jgi:hypothetical protein
MSEETTKIQSLTPQGSFESNGKTFYKFDCILENGLIGEVNALTSDKWTEGDEVMVKDHQQTKWGPRLKLDRPRSEYGTDRMRHKFSPVAPKNDDTTKGIVASWAVGCAMQAAGDPFEDEYDEIVVRLARIALKARKIIKDEVEV